MKRRFNFYFILLITVAVLTLASGSSQNIYGSSDYNHNDPQSDDSPFSLPFDSVFADQSVDGDGDASNGDDDDMDIDELPFP